MVRQVTDVTKKGKIIISILCLIIAVLIVLIVTSTAEQFVYFFNNNFDQRHIDIKDYYPGFYRNVEHDDHIGYYLNSDVARVRFVKKENDPFSDGGAAYYFELIEWVNTYTDGYSELEALQKEMIKWYEKTDLVIFSPRYPGKYKSEMELIEATRGVYFEEGEEYLVDLKDIYFFALNEIICLSNFEKSTFLLEGDNCFERYGITAEMSADEIVAKIKELIAEEKAKIEAQ